VTIDIGLDVHVDVTLAEGVELSEKRAEVLRKCVCELA
jgi:prefoldin subunit 5